MPSPISKPKPEVLKLRQQVLDGFLSNQSAARLLNISTMAAKASFWYATIWLYRKGAKKK